MTTKMRDDTRWGDKYTCMPVLPIILITNHINEWYSNIMPDEILYIDTVRELIEVRDGRQVIAGLDRTELLDLLDCLCTD